jgi:hypothetical protein
MHTRAGLRGVRDPEIPALAARHRRVLVSHDVGTGAGQRSSGVFLIPQSLDVAIAIDELLLIWLVSEAADWENRLEWLPL